MLDITSRPAYDTGMGHRYVRLSEQVRRAVRDCGLSRYAISKATGIDQATLSRFMSGERGLPMKTLDVLGAFLKLDVVMRERPKRKAR